MSAEPCTDAQDAAGSLMVENLVAADPQIPDTRSSCRLAAGNKMVARLGVVAKLGFKARFFAKNLEDVEQMHIGRMYWRRKIIRCKDDALSVRAKPNRTTKKLSKFFSIGVLTMDKVVPLADDKIPRFVALGRQVAVNAPQLTPEHEAACRCMLAAAQIPLENPEKAAGPSI